jgi:hypothetical protein
MGAQQRPGGGGDVCLAHQGFADQEGVDAAGRQARQIGARHPAFGHDKAVAPQQRRQALGGGKRGLEGPEIAVVDADEAGLEAEGALEFGFVVNFGQHVHAPVEGGGFQFGGEPVVDHGHDEIRMQSAPQARASATW